MKTTEQNVDDVRAMATVKLTKPQVRAVVRAIRGIPGELFACEDYKAFYLTTKALTIRESGDWGVISRELVAALYLDAHLSTNANREIGFDEAERKALNESLGYASAAAAAAKAAKKIRQAIGIAPATTNTTRVVFCGSARA